MPKVLRDYERVDFSYLMEELQGSSRMEEEIQRKPVQETVPEEKGSVGTTVDFKKELLKRDRRSHMDNRSIRYAYGKEEELLHDKDCELTAKIPDEEIAWSKDLIPGMKICPACYRRALIRRGIGDDMKSYNKYRRFLENCGAGNRSLYKLMVEHSAKIHMEAPDTMAVKVREDSWKMRWNPRDGHITLLHNNYIRLEDNTRYFTGEYHVQKITGAGIFSQVISRICDYSWEDHVMAGQSQREEQNGGPGPDWKAFPVGEPGSGKLTRLWERIRTGIRGWRKPLQRIFSRKSGQERPLEMDPPAEED